MILDRMRESMNERVERAIVIAGIALAVMAIWIMICGIFISDSVLKSLLCVLVGVAIGVASTVAWQIKERKDQEIRRYERRLARQLNEMLEEEKYELLD